MLVVAWSAVAAGCGSTSEAEAAARMAQESCAREQACSPYLLALVHGDLATCVARTELRYRGTTSLVGTSLTPDKLAACAEAIAALPCESMLGDRVLPEACRPTPGELADDLTCGSDWQCQSAYCSKPREGSCGACKPRGRSREACHVDADCEPGLACRDDECVTYGALAQSCDGRHPCAPGLHCQDNVCVPSGQLGARCDYGPSACDLLQGLTCVSASSTCEPIGLAGVGMACGTADDALVVCAQSGVCSMRSDGECLPPGGDGEACTRERCVPPAFCQGDVCRLPEPDRCM
jgi:hypothetical protein